MSIVIKSGSNGNTLAITSDGRALTDSVTVTEEHAASDAGDAVNIHTGIVSISAETVLLYIHNKDTRVVNGAALAFHITDMVVGIGGGTFTSAPVVTAVKNATAMIGTVVTANNDVDIKSNQNIGNTFTFAALTALKGASGEGLTSGENHSLGYVTGVGAAPLAAMATKKLPLVMPNGSSLGIKIAPNVTGSCDAYVEVSGYYAPS